MKNNYKTLINSSNTVEVKLIVLNKSQINLSGNKYLKKNNNKRKLFLFIDK